MQTFPLLCHHLLLLVPHDLSPADCTISVFHYLSILIFILTYRQRLPLSQPAHLWPPSLSPSFSSRLYLRNELEEQQRRQQRHPLQPPRLPYLHPLTLYSTFSSCLLATPDAIVNTSSMRSTCRCGQQTKCRRSPPKP